MKKVVKNLGSKTEVSNVIGLGNQYIYAYIYIYTIIYIYIYILYIIYVVFTTEGFSEVAIESWSEWDLNPRPLNSVQTF